MRHPQSNQRLAALVKTRLDVITSHAAELSDGLEVRLSPRKQWFNQRGAARRRGIPFRLTFEAWEQWWVDSGHYHERGKQHHQYVMARVGDAGAYELGNIECITARRNCIEGNERRQR
jgi:hypothetical protein